MTFHLSFSFCSGPESAKKAKLTAIYAALNSDPVDVAALRKLAISRGGLLTDEIRRKAWPKLLNVNVFDPPPKLSKSVFFSFFLFPSLKLSYNILGHHTMTHIFF